MRPYVKLLLPLIIITAVIKNLYFTTIGYTQYKQYNNIAANSL